MESNPVTLKKWTAIALASVALVFGVIAFVLGSAPFHGALALAVVAMPIALVSFVLGARRLSVTALYWALAAFLPIPAAHAFSTRIDVMLIFLGIGGVVVSALCLLGYVRAGRSA